MVFRQAAERSLREVLDAQMVALIAAADPDGPESVTPTARARDALRHAGLGPVRGNPLGQWREHLAFAVDDRHRRAIRSAARRRRAQLLLHRDRRHADPARGREPRHRLGRPAWPAGALHLQRGRRVSRSTKRRSRASASRWWAGSSGLALLLVATLALLLRWLLKPVRRLEREIKEVEAGSARTARRSLAARARGGHQQSQCAARRRTHAHPALSRHARQPRAQPEDAARRHAPVAAAAATRRQGAR